MRKRNFAEWTNRVNFRLQRDHGIEILDMPDVDYWRYYEMRASVKLTVALIMEQWTNDGLIFVDDETELYA